MKLSSLIVNYKINTFYANNKIKTKIILLYCEL